MVVVTAIYMFTVQSTQHAINHYYYLWSWWQPEDYS
jgi:hypothetical protein